MEPLSRRRGGDSLRAAFARYIAAALLLSFAGAFAIGFATNRMQDAYSARYQIPADGAAADGEIIRLYDEDGNYYTSFYTGSGRQYVWKYRWNPAANWLISNAQILLVPVWIALVLVVLANQFYRRRIKQPVDLLTRSAARVAANDLDFSVQYPRRDELGALCDSFETMRAALAAGYQAQWRQMEDRRRINAAFSHDLRTPLTVLKGQLALLRRYLPAGGSQPDRVGQALRVMASHIDRLERYVDGMAKLQRLEDIEPRRAPLSLRELDPALRAAAQSMAGGKAVTVTVEPGEGWLDAAIVQEVYENLLSNALRYAASAVAVRLQMEGSALALSVADDGAGFDPETRARAAEPFYRAPAQTDGGAHFGLGLNICKTLCERHDGSLLIENRAGGGGLVRAVFDAAPPAPDSRQCP